MKNYQDRVVFITGAAHGIGLSLAKLYDQAGAKVVACDVNPLSISEAQKALPRAVYYACDITKREAVYDLAKKVLATVGAPYILVNNAGIVENSNFLNCPDEKLERTMQVNVLAHFWTLKAFLPEMIKNGEGHLCQVASAAGLLGVKGLAAYCASKHAVVGFSNALRLELNDLTRGKIKVTVVCPGFINTGMFKGVKTALMTPLLDQNKIARIIFNAVAKNKSFVLEPFMVKSVPLLNALLPTAAFNWVANVLKVNNAMDDIVKK
ncbi:MAG: short-chain dehydrogenase/reductase SDR [uncultured bacterium]|nr:MAG: short-chain dehydrogenase/reductase SDR [uncultured bacterium]HLD45574.1 SDR family oxidoreductase [bacterium]